MNCVKRWVKNVLTMIGYERCEQVAQRDAARSALIDARLKMIGQSKCFWCGTVPQVEGQHGPFESYGYGCFCPCGVSVGMFESRIEALISWNARQVRISKENQLKRVTKKSDRLYRKNRRPGTKTRAAATLPPGS